MKKIHIENLRITIPRSMRHEAQAVGNSVGREIARSLATVSEGRTGTIRIDKVSAGHVKSLNGVGEHAARKVDGILKGRNGK